MGAWSPQENAVLRPFVEARSHRDRVLHGVAVEPVMEDPSARLALNLPQGGAETRAEVQVGF